MLKSTTTERLLIIFSKLYFNHKVKEKSNKNKFGNCMNFKMCPGGKCITFYFVLLLCFRNLKMGISYSHILTSTLHLLE